MIINAARTEDNFLTYMKYCMYAGPMRRIQAVAYVEFLKGGGGTKFEVLDFFCSLQEVCGGAPSCLQILAFFSKDHALFLTKFIN